LLRYIEPTGADDVATLSLAEPAILVQRTTAPEQRRRLICVELTEKDLDDWGGAVVVENHVNVLRAPVVGAPLLSRETLLSVLRSECMDRVIRCLSGSVAVSAYELENLPLPDEYTLASWATLDKDGLEQAIAFAFRPESACVN
jgi:adenine-specific DNA-methyltransferase